MRRPIAIALASIVVLASLGAVLMSGGRVIGKSSTPNYTIATGDSSAAIDARRAELLRRIDDARAAGHLRGVGYMALLGEYQSVLVAQRRAEAQGMTEDVVRDLNAAIDNANSTLDRHLHGQ